MPKNEEQAKNNHQAEILNRKIWEIYLILVHRLRCTWKQNLSEFSLVIGRWKSDKQARHVRRRWIDNFKFFSLSVTIANTYFLVPFYMYCSVQPIPCLEISGNKKAEIAKKLRTAQPQPKVTGSYKKKVCIKYLVISMPYICLKGSR